MKSFSSPAKINFPRTSGRPIGARVGAPADGWSAYGGNATAGRRLSRRTSPSEFLMVVLKPSPDLLRRHPAPHSAGLPCPARTPHYGCLAALSTKSPKAEHICDKYSQPVVIPILIKKALETSVSAMVFMTILQSAIERPPHPPVATAIPSRASTVPSPSHATSASAPDVQDSTAARLSDRAWPAPDSRSIDSARRTS